MSKSASGGAGGSGGVGGRSVETVAANVVERIKAGIDDSQLDYLRTGARDLRVHQAAFEGKNPNDVATGKVNTANSRRPFDPIKITAEIGQNGKVKYTLQDGTHRLRAARNAGATLIRAEVKVYGPRGRLVSTRTTNIRIPE